MNQQEFSRSKFFAGQSASVFVCLKQNKFLEERVSPGKFSGTTGDARPPKGIG
jgi:hypothetical protein